MGRIEALTTAKCFRLDVRALHWRPVQADDLMNMDYGQGIHVVVDKGTLDAIGLSDIPNARCRLTGVGL